MRLLASAALLRQRCSARITGFVFPDGGCKTLWPPARTPHNTQQPEWRDPCILHFINPPTAIQAASNASRMAKTACSAQRPAAGFICPIRSAIPFGLKEQKGHFGIPEGFHRPIHGLHPALYHHINRHTSRKQRSPHGENRLLSAAARRRIHPSHPLCHPFRPERAERSFRYSGRFSPPDPPPASRSGGPHAARRCGCPG